MVTHLVIPPAAGRRVFVGRGRELAELEAGWRDAADGRGNVFLICGEAGIGKTRLAQEIAAFATREGGLHAWGWCWDGGGAPALWPWAQILRTIRESLGTARFNELATRGQAYLAPLVDGPAIDSDGMPGTRLPDGDAVARHFACCDALTELLRNCAAQRPMVLVLDDLHVADTPSLLALQFIARHVQTSRILLVATYRELDARLPTDRATLLARIGRASRRIPLSGLAPADISALVSGTFRCPVADSVVDALHRTTAGNPLFIDEVVRLLLADPSYARLDHVPPKGLPIPTAVRDAVRERLRPLSDGCRMTLQVAAVFGPEIDLADLPALRDIPLEIASSDLEAARAAALLFTDEERPGRYRFAHALIRDTIHDDLPAEERRRLHDRIAGFLEQRWQGDGGAHAAEIAHHALAALPRGSRAHAIEAAVLAARNAQATFAVEEAATWYGRALQAEESGPAEPSRSVELLLAMGACQADAWNTSAAEETYRRAATLARRLVTLGTPGSTTMLASAALGLGGTGIGMPRSVANAELVTLLREAAGRLGDEEATLKARILSRLAVELYFSADHGTRRALADEASALLENQNDRAATAYVRTVRLIALWDDPDLPQRLRSADEAIAAAVAAGTRDLELRGRVFRLMDLVEVGDFDGWMRETSLYAELTGHLRLPAYQSTWTTLRIMNALWLGQLDLAERLYDEACALAEQIDDPHLLLSARVQLVELRRMQGRLGELEPMVRFATQLNDAPVATHVVLAMIELHLGNRAAARQIFDILAAQDFADLDRNNLLPSILAWLVEVACRIGDPRQIQVLHAQLEKRRDRYLSFPSRLCFGPVTYFLAMLDRAQGELETAASEFEAAIDHCRRSSGRPALAYALFAYAGLLGDVDWAGADARRARRLLEEAHALAEEIGLVALHGEIVALQTRLAATAAAALPQNLPLAEAVAGGSRVVKLPTRHSERREESSPVNPGGAVRSATPASTLRCEGGMWTIAHQGTVLRLKNSKGLRYLAELVRAAGRELHVLDLTAVDSLPAAAAGSEYARQSAAQRSAAGIHLAVTSGNAAPADARARAAYKQRLASLREQLLEAESFADSGRADALRTEIDALTDELSRSLGLGGRERPVDNAVERARLNVTRAIQTAIRRIREGNPELGRHFANAVHTGVFCRYAPESKPTIAWRL